MNEVGHNLPPDMADTAADTARDLSGWMAEHPVIGNEDEAREAKIFIDRGKLAIEDLEAERTGKVKPLNDQVSEINRYYKGPRLFLKRILDELGNRVTAFMLKEEETKRIIAEAARRKAEDAERIAREAETRETEAFAEASAGTLGIDIASQSAEADARFRDFERAAHQAALAERSAKVRIGGGFRRALSLRDKNTVMVDDPIAAIKDIGPTDEVILDAIVRASRVFKSVFGRWPKGITIKTERKS